MQIALTHRKSPRRNRPGGRALPRRRMMATAALSTLLLAGCGGGSSPGISSSIATNSSTGTDSSTGASRAGDVGPVSPARDGAELNAAPADKSAAGSPSGPAEVAKPGAPVVGVAPKLTKSASLDLRVKDISAAAAQVRSIAAGLQAVVLSEQIGSKPGRDPRPMEGAENVGGFGTITLSVPADKLDTALDQLASSRVGTVLQRNTSSQDVTARYVDTESRLKTMRASVERVRTLMAQAKDIGQVVALESEMSQREADLDSLGSQLEGLQNSVARSTLAVSLSTPGNETVKAAAAENGFLAGLRSGWDAFATSARGLLTAVGTVLPFAVFLGLVSAPLWFWWRRRQANQPVPAVVSSPPPAPAPAA